MAVENPTTSDEARSPGAAGTARAARWSLAAPLHRPALVFILLSILFGLPAVFLIPPFRGADEPAHFLRVYGIAQGQIVPSDTDEHGRRGILVPSWLNNGYAFFEAQRYRFREPGFNYRDLFARYWAQAPTDPEGTPVFQLYAGSESYAPIAYLPYVLVAIPARMARLDFVPMLWLMRLAGFAAMTAVAAFAIAITPRLNWTFLFIAMLPIATFERAIVSADGAALSFALVVTALCLRAASGFAGNPCSRSLWMTLCVLIKPSQIAFVMMEAMTAPLGRQLRRWRTPALVVVPGIVLTFLWLYASSADIAAWRMIEGTGAPPEQFNIGWKLNFLAAHPNLFLTAVRGSLADGYNLWRETMGGVGWRDTHLSLAVYVTLSVIFVLTGTGRLELGRTVRMRIAAVSAATVLGYCTAIFLIFYLAWTPVDAAFVHGVQGRYFTIVLAPAALVIAALVNRSMSRSATAIVAVAGAVVSGVALLDAIVRSQW